MNKTNWKTVRLLWRLLLLGGGASATICAAANVPNPLWVIVGVAAFVAGIGLTIAYVEEG